MSIGEYLSVSQKKRVKRRKRFFLIFYIFIGCISLFGLIWLIFLSPVFKIKNIIVNGNVSVSSSDVVNFYNSVFQKKHNFIESLLGKNNILALPYKIASSDVILLPSVSQINISKNYFTKNININIKERTPFAVWCFMPKNFNIIATVSTSTSNNNQFVNQESDEKCYWFDESGFLFKDGFDSEGSILMAIHDYSQTAENIGNFILPERFISNMISTINLLRSIGLNIKEVRLDDLSLEEIKVTTYNGPDLYFSLRFSPDIYKDSLNTILSLKNFGNLQYVDFRTPDRIFYK